MYAGKLCLFGGVNCDTLVAGTPGEAAEEVKHALRYAAPGGGLAITSGNSLLVGTKYDNYASLLSATRELGKYPMTPA